MEAQKKKRRESGCNWLFQRTDCQVIMPNKASPTSESTTRDRNATLGLDTK
jgi:hypothetical protein